MKLLEHTMIYSQGVKIETAQGQGRKGNYSSRGKGEGLLVTVYKVCISQSSPKETE